jgi:hypothetical protein
MTTVSVKPYGETLLVFELVCRDSSEIYHCLLLLSFGKSRFQPPIIWDQLFMTTVSEVRVLRSTYSTVIKDLWGEMRKEEKSPHTCPPSQSGKRGQYGRRSPHTVRRRWPDSCTWSCLNIFHAWLFRRLPHNSRLKFHVVNLQSVQIARDFSKNKK